MEKRHIYEVILGGGGRRGGGIFVRNCSLVQLCDDGNNQHYCMTI